MRLSAKNINHPKPRLHGDSDPDPDPDWLRLHGSKLDSNPDSDHLSHVDCDPDSNPDLGPGARVNAALDLKQQMSSSPDSTQIHLEYYCTPQPYSNVARLNHNLW